jgi:hypothetical protein
MEEFTISFEYRKLHYTATVRKSEKPNSPTHYWVILSDKHLIENFGIHHDYYYDGLYMQFRTGGNQELFEFHAPIMHEIEKEFHKF